MLAAGGGFLVGTALSRNRSRRSYRLVVVEYLVLYVVYLTMVL